MAKDLQITMLFDIYGDMLTQKQRDFITYYYDDDLSLSEIAQNEGITRQGVRDSIKRAEAQLQDFEAHLGLYQRFQELQKGLQEISDMADIINEVNMRTILSREINDAVSRIQTLTKLLNEA